MPFMPLPSKTKKSRPPVDSDNESSLDDRGNVKQLIDYEYDETTSESELPPRRAKKAAKRRIRRAVEADEASSNQSSAFEVKIKHKNQNRPRLVVEEKVSKKKPVEESEEESEESEVEEKTKKTKSKKTKKTKVSKRVQEESEEETEEESEEEKPVRNRNNRNRKRRVVEESEESEESECDEEETEESEEYDEDEEEDESEEEDRPRRKGMTLLELLNGEDDPRVPKKYNLKKEPANVRRFVELVQQENEEEDNIDNDITYFKSLSAEKQLTLMKVLEQKASPVEVQVPLKFKILEKVAANPDLARIAMSKYNALMNIDPSSTEYYKCSHWINGFTGLPLGTYKDLPVRLEDGPEKCQEFMGTVHKCMEEAIFGHDEAKLQIMQFVSSWIANPKAHGNVLSIHGPPGVGKTSLIKDGVAKALGRPFHFITLGGATDASFLDGHSYTYEGSTWGKIVDVLIQSKCMNPVIYFDELDKVSETPKGEEIMNMLIHITDGSQNDRFQDKYFTGINLDLSRCLFIFSHNDHGRVNPILKDRMYNIEVKGFNSKEKLVIAEKYLVNLALQEVGLFEKVSLNSEMIRFMIEHYTGGEQGVRELKRCIQTVVSKINLLRFFNNPKQVPFAITDFQLPFTVKRNHIETFLKRKDTIDPSIAHLYC
jgi:ATP-dependent Lon protease